MAQWLRRSTAVTVLAGPFVLPDGTRLTSLNIPAGDCLLLKEGQNALSAKNQSSAPEHDAHGFYKVQLNATDTDTVGRLLLTVKPQSTELPVRHEFMVVPPAIYDSLIATDALVVRRVVGAASYNPLTAQVDVLLWLEENGVPIAASGAAAALYTGAGNAVLTFPGFSESTNKTWFARAEPVHIGPGTYYIYASLLVGSTAYTRLLPLSVS